MVNTKTQQPQTTQTQMFTQIHKKTQTQAQMEQVRVLSSPNSVVFNRTVFSSSASLLLCPLEMVENHQKQAGDTETSTAVTAEIAMPTSVQFENCHLDDMGMEKSMDIDNIHCHPSYLRSAGAYKAKAQAEAEAEAEVDNHPRLRVSLENREGIRWW